ncbi:PPK2 family polyphosphate kinase [Cytophaga aurantiaca]|uniref:PPK2 family polyphosphate kinase n=1 Tax=Cytophaga aurantiaca TaxID=29530 RepID=UPI00036971FA|nr:PPK2 family polyphosphate kinase [Cytophaga aurantiaca]
MTALRNIPTLPTDKYSKKECKKKLKAFHEKLFELQNIFYADARFSLLIIIQGVDTAGKDGTIRHVMTSMNPMGIQVKSFKQPTEEELQHDFFWRIYSHFPAKGMIEVFNRSYYEDILVPSIMEKLTKENLHHRCELFNTIEQHLALNNIHVLKLFLHISKEEQEKRIQERLTQPHKRWKYAKEDKKAADKWNEYIQVYDMLIKKCNNHPWHIIPADKRWYRNFAVAKIITEHLESLKLKYPKL